VASGAHALDGRLRAEEAGARCDPEEGAVDTGTAGLMDVEVEEAGGGDPLFEGDAEALDLCRREVGPEEGEGAEGVLDGDDFDRPRHRRQEAPLPPGEEGAATGEDLRPSGDVEAEGDRGGKAPPQPLLEEELSGVAGKKETTP